MSHFNIVGGDMRILWDKTNPAEVEQARQTFAMMRLRRFRAFRVKDSAGRLGKRLSRFDPTCERIVFIHHRNYESRVTIQNLVDKTGLSTRTLQRWVKRGRLPKPKRAYGKGAGRGGRATWPASVMEKALELKEAEELIRSLRKRPHETLRKLKRNR